jgi:hypothetical protein
MRAEKRGSQDLDIIKKVKAIVVFPVPAIPLSQYILVSPASAAQATRSAKNFSLVFAVQERRPERDFALYAARFAWGRLFNNAFKRRV